MKTCTHAPTHLVHNGQFQGMQVSVDMFFLIKYVTVIDRYSLVNLQESIFINI